MNHQKFYGRCEAWQYQTYEARKHGRILVSHATAKGVACETISMGQNPSKFHLTAFLAVRLTPRAIRNTILSCLSFCCTNNRISIIISFLRVWINYRVQKLASFPEKRGVQTNRVYDLLEILRQLNNISGSRIPRKSFLS